MNGPGGVGSLEGAWHGFADLAVLGTGVLELLLATLLGACIAYHPGDRRTVDTLADAEAQKVFVLFSAIGAITGMMVVKYGTTVGFVVFGIGGLIRFRTDLRSAPLTARLIFVTLVGLACGLGLPHLAVLATAFGFVLIAVLDASTTYRIQVQGVPRGDVISAAHVYREVVERAGCRVLGERKSVDRRLVTMVFRVPRRVSRQQLEVSFETQVPESLRGVVDWETE